VDDAGSRGGSVEVVLLPTVVRGAAVWIVEHGVCGDDPSKRVVVGLRAELVPGCAGIGVMAAEQFPVGVPELLLARVSSQPAAAVRVGGSRWSHSGLFW
jgi:hypothetical protein